jgi:hypothetical protein
LKEKRVARRQSRCHSTAVQHSQAPAGLSQGFQALAKQHGHMHAHSHMYTVGTVPRRQGAHRTLGVQALGKPAVVRAGAGAEQGKVCKFVCASDAGRGCVAGFSSVMPGLV